MKWLAGSVGLVSWGASAGSLDYFVPTSRLFQVTEVALMYVSHRASLVSAKTLVLLFCFPTETLTGSPFLLDLAIYFCETCKN